MDFCDGFGAICPTIGLFSHDGFEDFCATLKNHNSKKPRLFQCLSLRVLKKAGLPFFELWFF